MPTFLIWDVFDYIIMFSSPKTQFRLAQVCRFLRERILGPNSQFRGKPSNCFRRGDYLNVRYLLWIRNYPYENRLSGLDNAIHYHRKGIVRMVISHLQTLTKSERMIAKGLKNAISGERDNYPKNIVNRNFAILYFRTALLFENYPLLAKYLKNPKIPYLETSWILLTTQSREFLDQIYHLCFQPLPLWSLQQSIRLLENSLKIYRFDSFFKKKYLANFEKNFQYLLERVPDVEPMSDEKFRPGETLISDLPRSATQ